MNTHDCVESRTDCVDVGLLAVLVASSGIQDVPSVQDQDEHMDLGGLQTLLGRALLRTANLISSVMDGNVKERYRENIQ